MCCLSSPLPSHAGAWRGQHSSHPAVGSRKHRRAMTSRKDSYPCCEHRRKLGEGLDARIPRLLIDFLAQLLSLEIGMLLYPPVCFDNLVRISGGCENLSNQSIRIQCDRRDELLQLCRRLLRGLNRWL